MHSDKQYIAIDLKSFYASVECVERGLDPLDTHLVVADASRTAKTICLAVSPSLKALGISSRARLFEVVQSIKSLNYARSNNGTCKFKQASIVDSTLRSQYPGVPSILYFPCKQVASTPRLITAAMSGAV